MPVKRQSIHPRIGSRTLSPPERVRSFSQTSFVPKPQTFGQIFNVCADAFVMQTQLIPVLLSRDSRIIDEFTLICSITHVELVVLTQLGPLPRHCTHVFVDPSFNDKHGEELITRTGATISIVHIGEPTLQVWQCATAYKAAHVFSLPSARTLITELLTPVSTAKATTIACVSPVGGSGTTVTAAALAARLSRTSESVVLVDCDEKHSGLDIVLGAESQPGARWEDILASSSSYRGSDVVSALPRAGTLPFLSSRAPFHTCDTVDVVNSIRQQSDFVVLDFGTTRIHEALSEMVDWTCIIVPSTVRAVAMAKSFLEQLPKTKRGLVVRTVPGTSLPALTIAEKLEVPLLTNVPTDSRIVEQIEQGCGPAAITLGSFSRAISHLADHVSYRDEVSVRAA